MKEGPCGNENLAAAGVDPVVPETLELPSFPSRAEEHLYLQLQRFAFCLDRHAAQQSDEELPSDAEPEAVTVDTGE